MKTVNDLNENELDELKDAYLVQLTESGEEVLTDIPIENVIAHYKGVMFTDEDFFCNLKTEIYTNDEILTIGQNMKRFGGSFMSAIGEALLKADMGNQRKLVDAFRVDCEKYLSI